MVQKRQRWYFIVVIFVGFFDWGECGSKVVTSQPESRGIQIEDTLTSRNIEEAPNSDQTEMEPGLSHRSGQLLMLNKASNGTGLSAQAEQAILNVWTDYGWLILQMIAFWGVLIIKACIVWIIWWWFYYGKNGGLYGSEGYANGLVIPDTSYLNFKDKKKGRPSVSYGYNQYGKIDNNNSGFPGFVSGAIDTLTQKFG